jgi:hypothetical protein
MDELIPVASYSEAPLRVCFTKFKGSAPGRFAVAGTVTTEKSVLPTNALPGNIHSRRCPNVNLDDGFRYKDSPPVASAKTVSSELTRVSALKSATIADTAASPSESAVTRMEEPACC